ncbi:hypothetical protein [Nocardioides dilutus]
MWSGYFLETFAVVVVFVAYWDAPDRGSYYETTAQVIATMYVAVAIEFFAGEGVQLDAAGRAEFVFLLAVSWLGLLDSYGALSQAPSAWTPSLAAAGLVASVFMVTTALGRRVNLKNAKLVKPVIYVAAFSPVLLLIVS